MATASATVNDTNKKVILKTFAPFTGCVKIDDAQKIGVLMPMYNLMEYREAYSKTSESLQQCNTENL